LYPELCCFLTEGWKYQKPKEEEETSFQTLANAWWEEYDGNATENEEEITDEIERLTESCVK
jgi:hypothetical protein